MANHNKMLDPLKTAFIADRELQGKIPPDLTARFSIDTEPTVSEDGGPLIVVHTEEGAIDELRDLINPPVRCMREVGDMPRMAMVNVEFRPVQG